MAIATIKAKTEHRARSLFERESRLGFGAVADAWAALGAGLRADERAALVEWLSGQDKRLAARAVGGDVPVFGVDYWCR